MNRQWLKLVLLVSAALSAYCLGDSETSSEDRKNSPETGKKADQHPTTTGAKHPVRWTKALKLKSLDAINEELAKTVTLGGEAPHHELILSKPRHDGVIDRVRVCTGSA